MKKVLILGLAGMLGHQIWRKFYSSEFSNSFDVYGTVRKSKDHYKRFNLGYEDHIIENMEVSDFVTLEKKLNEIQPNFIINCVGLTLRKKEISDFEKCYKVNSMLPQVVGQWCSHHNSKLIHFSTDCVFDGKKRSAYFEKDLPTALDHYGQSKYLGEVQSAQNLTLRLSIVGREIENKTELIEWILSQKNQVANGFGSVRYSGLTTNFVANEVIKIVLKYPELSGLYQISSQPISKYELVQKMNHQFNLNINLIRDDKYQSNKSLDCSSYVKKTGFNIPTWDDMIQDLYNDKDFYERLS
ncbi:MAG: SDR family oxidoreductase [Bdellovibrionaceae bacterium]|nr:SDR family oxidoreductase [Pseudobdellovibrionaceae bacterium]